MNWILYDMPWWMPLLWGFAVYAVSRFVIHYLWDHRR